ncbi:MAG: Mitochondrial distribution and morphology protein 31, mitochondrial precursor [Ramalina farinacea]|uniref:Mitochondrial distribution and morphology protein 31, mitochondrial n=1 Tax=Ramalina farinacea TaxID=258253 RepID=A0AA43TX71_9LECA|nr:Mitochondrial distribution and morphology protein 31, mitochondrial precursor [Ramalina farinacea]
MSSSVVTKYFLNVSRRWQAAACLNDRSSIPATWNATTTTRHTSLQRSFYSTCRWQGKDRVKVVTAPWKHVQSGTLRLNPGFRAAETAIPKRLDAKAWVCRRNGFWSQHFHTASIRCAHDDITDVEAPRRKEHAERIPSVAPQSNSPAAQSAPNASKQPRNLKDRLPHISHIPRPSREELLAAATGFWSRLKVRFKWFSIRSVRPFNNDEIGAFFSWFLLGHVLWVILGTTTFFSLAILAVNTVFAQETLAGWVGNYLTKSSGVKVVFESAIVPTWGDGVITFKNVFVSRRPGQGRGQVSKGSPTEEAAAAAAAVRAGEALPSIYSPRIEEEDANYTQFDLSLDTVDVTLSFRKWFNSKGLLRDVEIRGVRGVVDRTAVRYPEEYVDPRSYKHEHNPGDFEIDSFKMEDLLVTFHQPGGVRPFSVSIFNCHLPVLRRRWLFYDFLSANVMSGSFDESLFTIHPAQTHGYVGSQFTPSLEGFGKESLWKKQSRLRIDGLNISHLNRGVTGPFSWIYQGTVDIVADISFPADTDESVAKILSDFYDRLEATVTSNRHVVPSVAVGEHHTGDADNDESHGPTRSLQSSDEDRRLLVMDLRVYLNDIRASVPIFTRDLSYVNNALVRPIVAYMNSRKTFIPVSCRVVKRASEFDGSWTIFDSGLMDDLSAETYRAFAKDVTDDQARIRRFKKVGLWSLQLAVQAFFMGLAGSFA